ncbi:hypothetical protein L7F22_004560 [Adiantum nelumboides]|nr:hypothetical protein [Adiantum nelumboides]
MYLWDLNSCREVCLRCYSLKRIPVERVEVVKEVEPILDQATMEMAKANLGHNVKQGSISFRYDVYEVLHVDRVEANMHEIKAGLFEASKEIKQSLPMLGDVDMHDDKAAWGFDDLVVVMDEETQSVDANHNKLRVHAMLLMNMLLKVALQGVMQRLGYAMDFSIVGSKAATYHAGASSDGIFAHDVFESVWIQGDEELCYERQELAQQPSGLDLTYTPLIERVWLSFSEATDLSVLAIAYLGPLAMSQILNTGLVDEESDSGETQDAKRSPSRCSSSSSIVTDAMKAEKSSKGSASVETAWTDSKHSSYLDFMEANFVQNMFARSYCMEDVCGGTSQHHHHHHYHHYDRLTGLDEHDYNTAESQLHSWDTMETYRPVSRAKAPAGLPWSLLESPWVQHFRPRNAPLASLKTNSVPNVGVLKRDAETAFPAMNNAEHHQWKSNNTSDSKRSSKSVAPCRRIECSKAGEAKDLLLSISSSLSVGRSKSRQRRQVLWSTFRQVRRTQQKTGNFRQRGYTFKHVSTR